MNPLDKYYWFITYHDHRGLIRWKAGRTDKTVFITHFLSHIFYAPDYETFESVVKIYNGLDYIISKDEYEG